VSRGKKDKNDNLKPFRPGQSGNPNGRPPGKSLKIRIRELLAAMPPEEIMKAANRIGLTTSPDARDIMLLAQIQKAWKGDTAAARFLAEYTDGKPEQPIVGGSEPIKIYVDSRFKRD
jgi:hypothetical protein